MKTPDRRYWRRGRRSLLALFLLCFLSCTGTKTNNSQGIISSANSADTAVDVEQTDMVEIVNNNNEMPDWALWAMGAGIFCFALIIPSPFKLKGF